MMLNEILGYLIAPNGDYMSFGKWSMRIGFDSTDSYYHEMAVIQEMLKNKWYLKYPELGLTERELVSKNLERDIYEYFSNWSLLGFISIVNGNTEDSQEILGYFPSSWNFLQNMTLLLLKDAILYQKEIPSMILVDETLKKDLSIYTIYQRIRDELEKEPSYLRKKTYEVSANHGRNLYF